MVMVLPQDAVKQVAVEQIDAHVGEIRGRFGRFFNKCCNFIIIICCKDAKARSFFNGNAYRSDGQIRLVVEMERDHRFIIHCVNMIAREN